MNWEAGCKRTVSYPQTKQTQNFTIQWNRVSLTNHKLNQIMARLCCNVVQHQAQLWMSWTANTLKVWHNQHCVQDTPTAAVLHDFMNFLHFSSGLTQWSTSKTRVLTLAIKRTQWRRGRGLLLLCEGQTALICLFLTPRDASTIFISSFLSRRLLASHPASCAAVAMIDTA